MTSKRKVLSLEQRISVIKRHVKGETAVSIANSLNVGKTQIQSVIKNKEDILNRWEAGESGDRKIAKRPCKYSSIDEEMFQWFTDCRARNLPISGRMIQEKANMIAAKQNVPNFSASNGWLQAWQLRHNIRQSVLCGESASVSNAVIDDWAKRLPDICEGYAAQDIFNADETGLFFRTLPSKSMVQKGESAAGIKTSKDRISVLLSCSATGEKLRPLIIGKSENPRCFRGTNIHALGVDYYFNKKAWMTSVIFVDWLQKLNNKFKLQNRKIILFIDNCSSHSIITLSNIKLQLLPKNTTSHLQPCDAGIIQAVKLNYRKMFLRQLIQKMDSDKTATASDLAKSVSLLDAVIWLRISWLRIREQTIIKCFVKCGFSVLSSSDPEIETSDDCSDLIPILDGISLGEFVDFDNNIPTSAPTTDDVSQSPSDGEVETDGPNDYDQELEVTAVIDSNTASAYVTDLLKFAAKNSNSTLVDSLMTVYGEVQKIKLSSARQTKIGDFFKKV